jgi:hypothetical protein
MADSNGLPGRVVPAVLALAATALVVFGVSCSSEPVSTGSTSIETSAPDSTTDSTTDTATIEAAPGASALTDDEIAGLLWMREEEQLAHDVYVELGDLWGLRIFENIAASETTHIDAVVGLLDRYGIADPADGAGAGTFINPTIQGLYDRLIADGSRSLDAALGVGALIEELDISDLQARAAATEVAEITALYEHLLRGSRNHLRAFTSQLELRGTTYEPTQLDSATFDAIVSSETERGPAG